MADTVLRLRILRKLSDILSTVGQGAQNPFQLQTPVDSMFANPIAVFRGRSKFGDDDPLPMISILEVPIPLDVISPGEDSSYASGTWELLIQGFVEDDHQNPTDPAHVLLAATKYTLAMERKKNIDWNLFGMGKRVTGMSIGQGVVRPPDDVSAKAYFWLNLALDIVEDMADPFED